jgi:hypothetical protein
MQRSSPNLTTPDISKHGLTSVDMLERTDPICALNPGVFNTISIKRVPARTAELAAHLPNYDESKFAWVDVETSSGGTVSKEALTHAATVFYATCGGASNVSLPNQFYKYAPPVPYAFSGNMSLTYSTPESGSIGSLSLTQMGLKDTIDSVTTYSSSTLFQGLVGTISGITPTVCQDGTQQLCIVSQSGTACNVSNLTENDSLNATSAWRINQTVIVPGFTATNLCAWLDESTVFVAASSSAALINFSSNTFKLLTFPGAIKAVQSSYQFGQNCVVVSVVSGSGLETRCYYSTGTYSTPYTNNSTQNVALFLEADQQAVALNSGAGLINFVFLSDWVQQRTASISLGSNYQVADFIVNEGIAYAVCIDSIASAPKFVKLVDSTVISNPAWPLFGWGSWVKSIVSSNGISILTSSGVYTLGSFTTNDPAVTSTQLSCAVLFNGDLLGGHANNFIKISSDHEITNRLYIRLIRNASETPYPKQFVETLSALTEHRLYINTTTYYTFTLKSGLTTSGVYGVVVRGDLQYAAIMAGWSASNLLEPYLTPLAGPFTDPTPKFGPHVSYAVGTTLINHSTVTVGTTTFFYSPTTLRHLAQWQTERKVKVSPADLVSNVHKDRWTDCTVPIVLNYRNANINIFEVYKPCVETTSMSLHNDMTVDTMDLTGATANAQNNAERLFTTLWSSLSTLHNPSQYFGHVNVYDTFNGFEEVTASV